MRGTHVSHGTYLLDQMEEPDDNRCVVSNAPVGIRCRTLNSGSIRLPALDVHTAPVFDALKESALRARNVLSDGREWHDPHFVDLDDAGDAAVGVDDLVSIARFRDFLLFKVEDRGESACCGLLTTQDRRDYPIPQFAWLCEFDALHFL